MGEESTWFDFLPGLANLIAWAKQYLGREDPSQGFFFQGGPFVDSHFNLTHVFSALLVLAFVTLGAMSFSSAMRKGGDEAIVPPAKFSLRNLFEVVGDALWNLTRNIMGEQNGRKYLPLIGTIACFIFFSNVLALIPGMVPPTSTLKTNVALALTVFVITHVEGIRAQGIVAYPVSYTHLFSVRHCSFAEICSRLAVCFSASMSLLHKMVPPPKLVTICDWVKVKPLPKLRLRPISPTCAPSS